MNEDLPIETLAPTPAILAFLAAADLPTDDMAAHPAQTFFGVRREGELLAMAGLETLGPCGLLRSVATAPGARKLGLARRLVAHVETTAARRGIADLYLLATDAAPYFARLGYRPVPRAQAPDCIRGCRQFQSLCPTDATLMHKALAP